MSRRLVGAAVVLAVVAVGGAVLVGGLAPGESAGAKPGETSTPDGTATGVDATTDRTESTASSDGQSDERPPETTRTGTDSDYEFTIEAVRNCGTTCRDVTASLANAGSETRRHVRVTTKVYADGDLLWVGNETVGALAPGETHTSMKRVDVGLSGAARIQDNDGYVTIATVVRSDAGTTRFSERRQVT